MPFQSLTQIVTLKCKLVSFSTSKILCISLMQNAIKIVVNFLEIVLLKSKRVIHLPPVKQLVIVGLLIWDGH